MQGNLVIQDGILNATLSADGTNVTVQVLEHLSELGEERYRLVITTSNGAGERTSKAVIESKLVIKHILHRYYAPFLVDPYYAATTPMKMPTHLTPATDSLSSKYKF